MSLSRLVLSDVIHQNLEAAIHATVVEVETEAPDLERFAATLVLSGIDAGAKHVQNLVVTSEQRAAEYFAVVSVYRRLDGRRRDRNTGVHRRYLGIGGEQARCGCQQHAQTER